MKSANINFDKEKNVIIFPHWSDEDGITRDSIRFIKLEQGYSEEELGNKILEALETSQINELEEKGQNAWKIASNLKSWKAFWKKYESLTVSIDDEEIWNLFRYRKLKDGSYGLEAGDEEKYTRKFQEPLTAEQLGMAVLEQLKIK